LKAKNSMEQDKVLPPGQFERSDFPRFGLPPFANRFPHQIDRPNVQVGGEIEHPIVLEHEFESLPRVQQISDFHCVTTWSCTSLAWGGFRFSDMYHQQLVPKVIPKPGVSLVIVYGQDGYHSCLPLEDMLGPDVMLADQLDGQPLSMAHGSPLRLIAPAHYGYKNVKHIKRICLVSDASRYLPVGWRWMAHKRGRVALEERARWVPGWILRYVYRPMIGRTARLFAEALQNHQR
jgi:DMSO/TMAO reductase YedYZ molybdopterin-dependent catalytic subunit